MGSNKGEQSCDLLPTCPVAFWEELPLTTICLPCVVNISLSLDCYSGKAIVQKGKVHVALNAAAYQHSS